MLRIRPVVCGIEEAPGEEQSNVNQYLSSSALDRLCPDVTLTHLYADLAEHLHSLSRILQCYFLGCTDYHSSINLDQLRERESHIPRPRRHIDDKHVQLFPLLALW
jgi:hypothetical protein